MPFDQRAADSLTGNATDHQGGDSADPAAQLRLKLAMAKRKRARAAPQTIALPHRGELEQAYGRDFSKVTVTVDPEQTEAHDAEAITEGNHITVSRADTPKEVFLHEMSHVVQNEQSGSEEKKAVSTPDADAEKEARANAEKAASGQKLTVEAAPDAKKQLLKKGELQDASKLPSGQRAAQFESLFQAAELYAMRPAVVDANLPLEIWETVLVELLVSDTPTPWYITFAIPKLFQQFQNIIHAYPHGFFKALQDMPTAPVVNMLGEHLARLASAHPAELAVTLGYVAISIKGAQLSDSVREALDAIVKDAKELPLLKACMRLRFGISNVGGEARDGNKEAQDWEPKGLRRAYSAMLGVPPEHVVDNPALKKMGRYKISDESAEGFYSQDDKVIGMGYSPGAFKGGPLLDDTKDFQNKVQHEVGHAVDRSLSPNPSEAWARKNGPCWESYKNATEALDAIFKRAKGAIASDPKAGEIQKAFAAALEKRNFELEAVLKSVYGSASKDDVDKLKQLKKDPLLKQLGGAGFNHGPWDGDGNGVHAGDRTFHEAYENQWHSYLTDSRKNKVSDYQFRAPGEWFAEAYSHFYRTPDDLGKNLRKKDPEAYQLIKAIHDQHKDWGKAMNGKKDDNNNSEKKVA